MKRVRLILVTCVALAVPAIAVAQNSVPKQSNKPATHNQNSQNKQPKPSSVQPALPPSKIAAQGQQPPATEERNETIHNDNASTDWWTEFAEVIAALATVALAIIGFVAAKIALGTLGKIKEQTEHAKTAAEAARDSANLAKRSADFSEETTRKSQRADVLLECAGIVCQQAGFFDGNARAVLRFKNFGSTRANDVSFRVRLIIPGVPDHSAMPMPNLVIGQGQEQSLSFEPFRQFLTQTTFNDIAQGKISMQFESWLVYKDVFGGTYTTRDVGTFDHRTMTFRIEENIAG